MSKNTKANLKKYILSFLRICIAALAMWLVARGQDWGKIREIFSGLNPAIFAALLLLLFVGQTAVACRWYLLLRLQAIDIGLIPAIKLTFVGLFYNHFLPSSVGGDLLRAWYVTKHTPKRLEAILSVFIDRLIAFGGLVAMAFVAYLLFPKGSNMDNLNLTSKVDLATRYKWFIISASIAISLIFLVLCLLPRTRRPLKSGYTFVMTTGRQLFIKFSKAVLLYCRKPLWMLLFLGIAFFCQIVFIFGLWLVGRELGITAGFVYYLVIIPISWVIGMLPVSIGGIGIMEGGLVLLFVQLAGVDSEKAFALALCQRLALLIVSLPGMFIHIAGGHVPAEFSIDAEADIN